MTIYSAVLFGHHKPNFYLQDIKTGKNVSTHLEEPDFDPTRFKLHRVTGNEKRCSPGDIVSLRPMEKEYLWTPLERSQFLIVRIEIPDDIPMPEGLVEQYWDVDSYNEFNPVSFEEMDENLSSLAEEGKNKWLTKTKEQKQEDYEAHIALLRESCAYPTDYLKKRRMGISLDTLKDAKVDLERMLDPNIRYDPKLEVFKHLDCWDKMKKRKLVKEDKLRRIDRREV